MCMFTKHRMQCQCASRKAKTGKNRYIRCPHTSKNASEYCARHSAAKVVWRFDEPLPLSKKESKQIVKRYVHGWIIRTQIKKLFGPAWKDIKMIDDEMDCVTLERFWTIDPETKERVVSNDIPRAEIYSYLDPWNSRICGFRFSTIHKLASLTTQQHPITRLPLQANISDICERRITFMKQHGLWKDETIISEPVPQTVNDFIDLITSKLTSINLTISNSELIVLSDEQIRNMYIECGNIWHHADQTHMRSLMSEPLFNWSRRTIIQRSSELRHVTFESIWKIIQKVGDAGCFFFVLALGYVVQPIRLRFPYLFLYD